MPRSAIGILLAVGLPLCIVVTTLSQVPAHKMESGPTSGTVVRAIEVAPIRESPPNGYLRRPGKKVSDTDTNRDYVISNVSTSPYMFSAQTWVEVSVDGENEPIGWVYWGAEENVDSSSNFELPVIDQPAPVTDDSAPTTDELASASN